MEVIVPEKDKNKSRGHSNVVKALGFSNETKPHSHKITTKRQTV